MNSYKIIFEDGNSFITGFNGSFQEASAYYENQSFQFGDTEERPYDYIVKAIKVEVA